jgi:hypothetical protein
MCYLFYGINIAMAAYPQYHDGHPCMCRYSSFSDVTTPYLAYLPLAAACCRAVAAAAQWHRMPQLSACCAGLQASEPKKLPGQA